MQLRIAILSTLGSILGIIGFFISQPMFFIGGVIAFLGLLLYGETFIRNRDKLARDQEAQKANSKEEKENALKKNRRIQVASRVITAIVFTLIFLIFKLNGICWIGIVFGLMFIPELLGRIISLAANKA